MTEERMLTTVEVAEALGVSRKYVVQMIQEGLIQGKQYGRSWLIPQSEVKRYQRERKPAGRPPMKKDV
jgi:excisionase family DNA binding protein